MRLRTDKGKSPMNLKARKMLASQMRSFLLHMSFQSSNFNNLAKESPGKASMCFIQASPVPHHLFQTKEFKCLKKKEMKLKHSAKQSIFLEIYMTYLKVVLACQQICQSITVRTLLLKVSLGKSPQTRKSSTNTCSIMTHITLIISVD